MSRMPMRAVGLALAVGLGASGCALGEADTTRTPTGATTGMTTGMTPSQSASVHSTASATPLTPKQAMTAAGLTLPVGASDVSLRVRTDSPSGEAYVVTFTAARADALALCASGGKPGDSPAVRISLDEQKRLGGSVAVTGKQRICSGLNPTNMAWQRDVLIEDGDPATVRIGIERMPAR